MYEPYEVETISEGRLTARILQDTDPLDPFEYYEPPCAVVVTGNTRDYGHLSTASLDDYAPDSVYQLWHSDTWYRETPAGNEVEIGDDDDMIAYLETRAGAVAERVSFWGIVQSEWWDAVLIMDRDTIRREVSQYNRKNRPAPRIRVSDRIEHYDHAAQEWKAGDDPRPLPPTVTASDREKAREMIRGYAATIRQYMQGDVYMVMVEDGEGERVDSLGSIYGLDYALEEARAMLASALETHPEYQYPDLESWEDPEYQREEEDSTAA